MSRLRRFKPTGSLLVALAALVFATTGSAVGASLITSKKIKDGTIQTKDISKKARGKLKGNTGPQGPQGPQGTPGAKGDTGAPGSAAAYALIKPGVAPSGSTVDIVDESRSKNVADANVFHPQTGVYCFKNLDFTPKSVIATIQEASSGGPGNYDIPYARTDDGSNYCFSPWQANVITLHNGTTSNLGVFVLFN
jgi:hypothetical protein